MCRVCGIYYVRVFEFLNDNIVIYEREENWLKDVNLSYSCECLNDFELIVKILNDLKVDFGSFDSIDLFWFLMKCR